MIPIPENNSEINPDHDLSRILNALRTADPPAHMQDRLLQTMQQKQASDRAYRASNAADWMKRRFALPLLGTAAITAAALILLLLPGANRNPTQYTSRSDAPGRAIQSASGSEPEIRALARSTTTFAPEIHKLPNYSRPQRRVHARPPTSSRTRSYPAPQAPLTQQEKLLQHIARTGGEQEFAMLNPEMRASKAQ